jgi:hypothetical protein
MILTPKYTTHIIYVYVLVSNQLNRTKIECYSFFVFFQTGNILKIFSKRIINNFGCVPFKFIHSIELIVVKRLLVPSGWLRKRRMVEYLQANNHFG